MFTWLQNIKHPSQHFMLNVDTFSFPDSPCWHKLQLSYCDHTLNFNCPSIHPSPPILSQNTNLLQLHEQFNILILRKYTNWGEDSWTCKNMTDLPRHVLSTFLQSYLWQYRHNLHAVFCLEIVQSPVGVKLLCRWGPNTWMAAQYLELHMLKNENSPLKSRMNIYIIHKSTSFNLMISRLPNFIPVNFSPLLSMEKQSNECVCVCETSAITSFSSIHSLPLYFHTSTCPSANPYNTNPTRIKPRYVCWEASN